MTAATKEKAHTLFRQGVAQAKAGRKRTARKLIRQSLSIEPDNGRAWLYLLGIAENRQDAVEALRRVEGLEPTNPHLEKAKAWIAQRWPNQKTKREARPASTAPPARKAAKPWGRVFGALLTAGLTLIIILVLLAASETDKAAANFIGLVVAAPTQTIAQKLTGLKEKFKAAQNEANQPAMIASLEEMRALLPDDPEIAGQLAAQYFDQGMILRNGGNFEAAKKAFDHALKVEPDFELANQERNLVGRYLAGVEHHQEGRWDEAAAAFEELYRQEPGYPFVSEILFSSLYNQGLAKQNQGRLDEAIQAFEQAGQILPHRAEVEKKLIELRKLLTPPTPAPSSTPPTPAPSSTPPAPVPSSTPPTPAPSSTPSLEASQKRVVVDISEQRAYLYQGETLVYQFIISTGEPGRDTAIGEFEILNKIPVAYASTWNLDMPYWLGIYWSGSLQNGFHALPTVRHTGYTLWDGFLGQRVSYGCIILSYADAQTLYDWVDIGTPVIIRN